MRKSEILTHWAGLPENQPVNPEIIPYKHRGSTFDEDSIRITGSQEFIDSVLSRLKDLLKYESADTRLQVMYQESQDKKTKQPTGSYCAYVQVHERGAEAKMVNHFMGVGTKG